MSCGIVVGVVRLVDDGAVVLYFGNLAVVSYDAVVAACDAGRAGVDVVGVGTKRSMRNTGNNNITVPITTLSLTIEANTKNLIYR